MDGFIQAQPYDPDRPSPGGHGHHMAVQFTGSGSEYFRIWAVNLLLMLVTLGIYYPFAKLRRLRYFHGNTVVDGQPLAFHGNGWAMLRGYGLMAVLFAVYGAATALSLWAGLLAVVALGALWPALFRASMQFRMANTSWRGIRLRFTGDLPGAYVASAVWLLLFGVLLLNGMLVDATGELRAPQGVQVVLSLLLPLIGLAFPYGMWAVKAYQHRNYRYAGEQMAFVPNAGSFYRVGFITSAVTVGVVAAFGVVAAIVMGALGGQRLGAGFALLALLLIPAYVLLMAVSQSFYVSRMQNLIWNGSFSPNLRFECKLAFGELLRLNLKNWLLILITLGLYWPFAKVAAARLRLQALSLLALPAFEASIADGPGHMQDAAGEAAGDIFGIDFGL